MPIFEIRNQHKKLGEFSCSKLLAKVSYPNNQEKREELLSLLASEEYELLKEYAAKVFFRATSHKESSKEKNLRFLKAIEFILLQEVSVNFGLDNLFSRLIRCRSKNEVIQDCLISEVKGVVAGQILILIMQIDQQNGPRSGSVNMAVHLMETGFENIKGLDEKYLPSNNRFLRNAWSEYKCVAHFWASIVIWVGKEGLSDRSSLIDAGNLSGILALAESFREFGENHYARARKEPTLNPRDTFRVSDEIDIRSITYEPRTLSAKQNEVLGKYRAPQRI